MNLIRLFLLIVLGLITSSCQQFQEECREDLVMIHNIMNDHIRHMKDEYQIKAIMSGGGFMDDINKVGFGFSCTEKGSIELARKLIVYGTEKLLKEINDSEEIRPYLHNFPFTAENIRYGVTFFDENFKIQQKVVAHALLMIGTISYSIDGPPEKPGYQDVLEETYEEALEIVRRDYPGLLKQLDKNNGESFQ